jgi:hypothetical protein
LRVGCGVAFDRWWPRDPIPQAAAAELPPLIVRSPLERFLDEHGLGEGPVEAERIGEGHSNVTFGWSASMVPSTVTTMANVPSSASEPMIPEVSFWPSNCSSAPAAASRPSR